MKKRFKIGIYLIFFLIGLIVSVIIFHNMYEEHENKRSKLQTIFDTSSYYRNEITDRNLESLDYADLYVTENNKSAWNICKNLTYESRKIQLEYEDWFYNNVSNYDDYFSVMHIQTDVQFMDSLVSTMENFIFDMELLERCDISYEL